MANHQNNFATNLTSNVSAGVTTSPLNSIPSVDAPFYLAFDATNVNGNYEVVLCSGKTATNVNHPALANDHLTDEEVRMVVSAEEMDAINAIAYEGNVEYYTSSGTWTKPTGLKHVVVEVVGGGGAGGGRRVTTGVSFGSGGGGGGYCLGKILAADLGATETVTVGAKGTGRSANSGLAGGTSSFGAHAVASGGGGGAHDYVGTGVAHTGVGGAGGTGSGTGKVFGISGTQGSAGRSDPIAGVVGSQGGTSFFSNAGSHAPIGQTGTSGTNPSGYGGGGGGMTGNSSNVAGGNGTSGIIIVKEYF